MADQGCSLEEIVAAAEAAANHMGVYHHCNLIKKVNLVYCY